MRTILRRASALLRRERLANELAEELETHRLLLAERLRQSGMDSRAADAASRRAMGNTTLAREDSRAMWIAPWLESVGQDIRYALRALFRERGFACVAIATLTAAIGLNTTIFTIFHALVLAPWPVADPSGIVTIHNASAADVRVRGGGAPGGFSLEQIDYFREHSRTLAGVVAIRSGGGDQTLGDDDTPAEWVSGNYFSLLGVEMALGRGFLPQEDDAASPSAVAVLSFGYWSRALARDSSAIGRTLVFDDVPFTVVGVTAERFTGTSPDRVDVWLPMASTALVRPDDRWTRSVYEPRACCVRVAARLAPGVDRARAEAELVLLNTRYRGAAHALGGVRVAGTEFAADRKTSAQSMFTPVLAAVMLILSLACANVGNLLLARATARRREIAVRLSLGASRGRVARQLLTESLVLALIAGALGLWIAFWAPARLMALLAPSSGLGLSPNTTVLAFSALLSLLACALFGLLPALHGARTGVSSALKAGPLPRLAGLSVRNALLALQVAIAVVLVSAAGLLTRAVYDASSRALGFSMDGLSTIAFTTPSRGYDAGRIRQLALDMEAAVQPLVAAGQVALTSTPPLASGNIKGSFALPGGPSDEPNQVYEVSPGYFELLDMRIVEGRSLREGEADSTSIVVNQVFARTYWPGSSAVGRTILVDGRRGGWNRPGELRIVGVVHDAAMNSLTSVDPTIYQTLSGRAIPQVIVRDGTNAAASVLAMVAALDRRLDPRVQSLASNLTPQTRRSRVAAIVAAVLGSLALLLACVGMAGVFAYVVQQRTHEIGVRMALGARHIDVIHVVVRSSLLATGTGAVAGVLGAFLSSAWLRSYLLGLSPIDPLAHASVLIVLASAGIAATFVPARRAARIAPVDALRNE
jgi:predicted permease